MNSQLNELNKYGKAVKELQSRIVVGDDSVFVSEEEHEREAAAKAFDEVAHVHYDWKAVRKTQRAVFATILSLAVFATILGALV